MDFNMIQDNKIKKILEEFSSNNEELKICIENKKICFIGLEITSNKNIIKILSPVNNIFFIIDFNDLVYFRFYYSSGTNLCIELNNKYRKVSKCFYIGIFENKENLQLQSIKILSNILNIFHDCWMKSELSI